MPSFAAKDRYSAEVVVLEIRKNGLDLVCRQIVIGIESDAVVVNIAT